MIAAIVALGLLSVSLNFFNLVVGKQLEFNQLLVGWFPPLVAIVVLVVTCLGGLVPSMYMTRFLPAEVLRGKSGIVAGNVGVRSSLVIVQFMISAIMIIFTSTVRAVFLQSYTVDLIRLHFRRR